MGGSVLTYSAALCTKYSCWPIIMRVQASGGDVVALFVGGVSFRVCQCQAIELLDNVGAKCENWQLENVW